MIGRLSMMALLVVSIAACTTATAPNPAGTDDRAVIASVLTQLTEAQKNYDAAAMDRLLAPDYVEISPVGELDARAEVLGFYTPERKADGGELTSYALEELTTRVYGDTAVAVARLPFVMKMPDGQSVSRAFRCTFVLVRSGSSWQIATSQFTAVGAPEAAAGHAH